MYSPLTAQVVQQIFNPRTLYPNPRVTRPQRTRLGEYRQGTYPVPFWNYLPPSWLACALARHHKQLRDHTARKWRALGDDTPMIVQSDLPPIDPITGQSLVPGSTANIYGSNVSDQALVNSIVEAPVPLPGVSSSTLIAAAALPNAPAVVKQAAAQYQAANPASSFLSGSMIAGIPNYLLLGAGGILLVVLATAKKR